MNLCISLESRVMTLGHLHYILTWARWNSQKVSAHKIFSTNNITQGIYTIIEIWKLNLLNGRQWEVTFFSGSKLFFI